MSAQCQHTFSLSGRFQQIILRNKISRVFFPLQLHPIYTLRSIDRNYAFTLGQCSTGWKTASGNMQRARAAQKARVCLAHRVFMPGCEGGLGQTQKLNEVAVAWSQSRHYKFLGGEKCWMSFLAPLNKSCLWTFQFVI